MTAWIEDAEQRKAYRDEIKRLKERLANVCAANALLRREIDELRGARS